MSSKSTDILKTEDLGKITQFPDIPKSWLVLLFEQVVFFQEGPGLRKYQFRENGIPFLNIRTLKNERVDLTLCQYLDPDEVSEKYQHFLLDDGDIVASSSGTLGKTAVIYQDDLPLMLNTSIIRFRPYGASGPLRNYIYLFLKSEYFLLQARQASTGSAQVNFGPSHLREMKFFLPPLNEQRRIVAKIEALKARSQRVKEELEAIAPLLDQFRQSVLAAAFRGDLTADWREKNPDVEPASVLLERIRAERRRRWEEAELEKMKAQGKTPKDDKWKEKYEELEPVDTAKLPELPEGWCWAAAAEIVEPDADIVYGIVQPGLHISDGIPYVRGQDIQDGKIVLDQLKRTSLEIAKRYVSQSLPRRTGSPRPQRRTRLHPLRTHPRRTGEAGYQEKGKREK